MSTKLTPALKIQQAMLLMKNSANEGKGSQVVKQQNQNVLELGALNEEIDFFGKKC